VGKQVSNEEAEESKKTSELEQQIENRRQKRRRIAELGVDVYPRRAAYDLEPTAIHATYDERDTESLEAEPVELTVPGRIRALRSHGKTAFLDLHDGATKLQVMVRKKALSEGDLALFEELDLGDYILVAGTLMRTRTGELTLLASGVSILGKALRPLPEKWHGLADVEARYRQRYLDLMSNPESRSVFETRARIISTIRRFLDERGFLEVETPMMQPLAGGAAARPFSTHHNALDIELYLRIAPELFLKRLLVGGMHRVYEINRNFRNEGISTQHNPEFTMLEFYWAYADYEQLIDLTEELFAKIADEVLDEPQVTWREREIDLSRPWKRYSMRGALAELGGVALEASESAQSLAEVFEREGLALPKGIAKISATEGVPESAYGHLLVELFETQVEEKLIQPTFITDFPVSVSPFAKASGEDARFTERFELYIGGMEIANAFTELNDPEIQAERFRAQLAARELGDDEAQLYDEDFVVALEHGMPPAGGEGIGIDRLAMLFSGASSIRDVILFPLMRPQATRPDGGDELAESTPSPEEAPQASSDTAPSDA